MSTKKKVDAKPTKLNDKLLNQFIRSHGKKGFGMVLDLRDPEGLKTANHAIVNRDAKTLIATGIGIGREYAIFGGEFLGGCVGYAVNEKYIEESLGLVHSRMSQVGYGVSIWTILVPEGPVRDRITQSLAAITKCQSSA